MSGKTNYNPSNNPSNNLFQEQKATDSLEGLELQLQKYKKSQATLEKALKHVCLETKKLNDLINEALVSDNPSLKLEELEAAKPKLESLNEQEFLIRQKKDENNEKIANLNRVILEERLKKLMDENNPGATTLEPENSEPKVKLEAEKTTAANLVATNLLIQKQNVEREKIEAREKEEFLQMCRELIDYFKGIEGRFQYNPEEAARAVECLAGLGRIDTKIKTSILNWEENLKLCFTEITEISLSDNLSNFTESMQKQEKEINNALKTQESVFQKRKGLKRLIEDLDSELSLEKLFPKKEGGFFSKIKSKLPGKQNTSQDFKQEFLDFIDLSPDIYRWEELFELRSLTIKPEFSKTLSKLIEFIAEKSKKGAKIDQGGLQRLQSLRDSLLAIKMEIEEIDDLINGEDNQAMEYVEKVRYLIGRIGDVIKMVYKVEKLENSVLNMLYNLPNIHLESNLSSSDDDLDDSVVQNLQIQHQDQKNPKFTRYTLNSQDFIRALHQTLISTK